MNERGKLRIHEERLSIYARDKGICQACGTPCASDAFQIAHRIANMKSNRKKWGAEIIDHPLNKAATHAGACNDAMNIGFNPMRCWELIEKILEAK